MTEFVLNCDPKTKVRAELCLLSTVMPLVYTVCFFIIWHYMLSSLKLGCQEAMVAVSSSGDNKNLTSRIKDFYTCIQ